MEHSFDVELAKEIGVNPAIIFKNILFWINKNQANEKHFYDGKYWTYNSIKAFKELFPYMSEKSIRNSLKKLEDLGFIETGNFNKSPYDRTKWYSLKKIYKPKSINTTSHLGNVDIPKKANGNSQKGEPIPDSNTDINHIMGVYNNINLTKEKEEHEKNKERDISPPPIMQDEYTYRNVESDFPLNNQNANNNFEHIDWRAFCEMFNKETGKSVNAILPRTRQNIEQLMRIGYTKQHLVKAIHKAKENEYIKKNPKLLTPTHIFEPENFERYVT